ncbi:MAG: response regulator [Mucilaginibacter sp.]|nr:response regulator [Mucilaginibacter sp.]
MLKRVLVLDDNQDILDVVQETLSYEKFEVKSTSNSDEVMSLVKEFDPDLIILDYRVAGTNGGEVCKQIKSHPDFNDKPVIIFSAYINHQDEIMAYGCDAVINKPFDLAELIDKVNDLINQV